MRYLGLVLSICVAACGQDPVQGGDTLPADTLDGVTPPDGSDSSATDTSEDVAIDDATDTEDASPADTADTAPLDTADTAPLDTADTAPLDVDADADATPDVVCASPDECTMCAFRARVAGPDDCYCVLCPSFPMTASECAANQASWEQHCTPWPRPDPCPVASCLPSPRPLCVEGVCQRDPNACVWGDDCGACRFAAAPETAADCRCPTCPRPLAKGYCAEIEETISIVCTDFDFDGCPIVPCPLPPPIICTESFTCGYGELTPPPDPR